MRQFPKAPFSVYFFNSLCTNTMWPPAGYNDSRICVRHSDVHGRGLFSNAVIPENTILCTFSGTFVKDRNSLSANALRYAIHVPGRPHALDCEPPPATEPLCNYPTFGWASFANSDIVSSNARRDYIGINRYLSFIGCTTIPRHIADILPPVLCLVSTRQISEGEEICWNYPCYV